MYFFPGWRGVQWQCSHAASLLKYSRDSRTVVQLSGTIHLRHLKRSRRSKLQRRCVGWRSNARTVEMDRKTLACSVTAFHHLCWSWVFLLVLFRSWTWRSFLNKLSLPETRLSGSHCPFTVTLWLCYWGQALYESGPASCDTSAFLGFVFSSWCFVIPVKPCIFKGFH